MKDDDFLTIKHYQSITWYLTVIFDTVIIHHSLRLDTNRITCYYIGCNGHSIDGYLVGSNDMDNKCDLVLFAVACAVVFSVLTFGLVAVAFILHSVFA